MTSPPTSKAANNVCHLLLFFVRFEDPNSIPDDYWHWLESSEANTIFVNYNDPLGYF